MQCDSKCAYIILREQWTQPLPSQTSGKCWRWFPQDWGEQQQSQAVPTPPIWGPGTPPSPPPASPPSPLPPCPSPPQATYTLPLWVQSGSAEVREGAQHSRWVLIILVLLITNIHTCRQAHTRLVYKHNQLAFTFAHSKFLYENNCTAYCRIICKAEKR